MKFTLIYPRWPKLSYQTEFHLPPHGPVVFAAALPDDVDVTFVDENLETIDFDAHTDVVGISMMLTAQVKRGWAIADRFRPRGPGNLRRDRHHAARRRNRRPRRCRFSGRSRRAHAAGAGGSEGRPTEKGV
jgi:hypothetical protein